MRFLLSVVIQFGFFWWHFSTVDAQPYKVPPTHYENNIIAVRGVGIQSTAPDGFDVDIRISVDDLNVTSGKLRLAKSLDHIIYDENGGSLVNDKNFKIIPGRFAISRNYVYENHTSVPKGYSLSQELKVKAFSVDSLSQLIEKVVTTDNSFVEDTRPFVLDSNKLEAMALRNALFDATAKAQTLAQAIGAQAVGPFFISTLAREEPHWEKKHGVRSESIAFSGGFTEAWAASVVTVTQSLIAKYHLVPGFVLSG